MENTHEVYFDLTFIKGNLEGTKIHNHLQCAFPCKKDAEKYVDDIFLKIATGKLKYNITRAVIKEI